MIATEAHAKINWSLAVCGQRPNGYHELDMLMQTVCLHDDLTFEEADTLSMECGGRTADDSNLVLRAARALNEAAGTSFGAHITLEKHIPARAGLGGGSADCAAALKALNTMWKLGSSDGDLMRIGLQLGADVPFCLLGGFARVRGIGEILQPLVPAPGCFLVMITPGGGLSTPEVFRVWNDGGAAAPLDNAVLAQALGRNEFALADRLTRNDLERPAAVLMPEIARIMEYFRENGSEYVRMSGSGSTVFAVFTDGQAAHRVQSDLPGSILTHTV